MRSRIFLAMVAGATLFALLAISDHFLAEAKTTPRPVILVLGLVDPIPQQIDYNDNAAMIAAHQEIKADFLVMNAKTEGELTKAELLSLLAKTYRVLQAVVNRDFGPE